MLAPGLGRNHSRCLIGFAGWCAALALPIGVLVDVPIGTYQVSFRPAVLHASGPKRPMKISVNEENQGANLSIKWLVSNNGGRP